VPSGTSSRGLSRGEEPWTQRRGSVQLEQATAQLAGTGIELQKLGRGRTHVEALAEALGQGAVVGVTPDMLSRAAKRQLEQAFVAKGIQLRADTDLLAGIWTERPALPAEPVVVHRAEFVSETAAEKLARVRAAMQEKGAAHHLISSLDDIAWLTNLRGNDVSYNPVFLAMLGVCGGFIDASGGGGWGPVTSSTLMSLGRTEPRRVIGAVNTAEFLVTLAATLGFALGMWHDLVANAVAVAGLLLGGVIAAPLAAWLVSRVNPFLLGGVVGTSLVFLNSPKVLALMEFSDRTVLGIRLLILLAGCVGGGGGGGDPRGGGVVGGPTAGEREPAMATA